jgi:hypothetical protein
VNAGFRLFVLLMVSALCVIFLAASYYSWSMADLDCFEGYMKCRRTWWGEEGLIAGGTILIWLATLLWFLKSRKSS